MRASSKLRVGLVLVALVAPVVALAPGCGARSGLGDEDGLFEEEDGGTDADAATDGDASPDALPDVSPDVEPDALPDVAPDVEPDVAPDVTPDVEPDVLPDVSPDVEPDVLPDVAPDVEPDVAPDVLPDVLPDVVPDVLPDVVPDGPCPDADGDGYSTCDNDCDDGDPTVNPGAFDFPNGVDDDCDGTVDMPILDCSQGLQYTSQNAVDYAKAIDICQQTTLNATGAQKKWGLVSAEFRLADGTGSPGPQQHSIVTQVGVVGPRKNASFVFLSTGQAGAPGQPYFTQGTPQGGTAVGTQSNAPPGFPLNKQSCPQPASGAFDPVNLKLRLRTPTNAQSFGFSHAFYSAEYPEYACTVFNDSWVALLHTGAPGIANNKNIVFDAQGTPGSVNLNFFDRCVAGKTGCFGGTIGFNFCSGGAGELSGTGYGGSDPSNPCGQPTTIGGGTGWLVTEAEILPGEIMTLELMLWDSTDQVYDSAAVIDDFHWIEGTLPTPVTYRP